MHKTLASTTFAQRVARNHSTRSRCASRLLHTLVLGITLALPALSVADSDGVAAAHVRYPIHVQRIGINEGLSQNTVLDALQDSQGFVWLATENGLNRFDGYSVTRYHRGATPGLPDDFVYSLAEDHQGNIWVGTARGGLARWIRDEDRFERVEAGSGSSSTQRLRKLLVGARQQLWVGTRDAGLILRSLTTGKQQDYRASETDENTLPSDRINTLYEDRAGLLWVGTDQGLARFDEASNSFVRFGFNGGNRGTSDNDIRAIYEDTQGVLWIGTESGDLNAYHRNTGQFIHYPGSSVSGGGDCGGTIRAITEDLSQRLWSATGQGLCLFERSSSSFINYAAGNDANSLGDNDLLSLMLDRSGQLWIGTRSDGVNLWNPQSWQLGHSYAAHAIGSVSSFATDPRGFWVGSTSRGLFRVNPSKSAPRFFTTDDGLTDNSVMSLAASADGGLWVGTMKGGLLKLSEDDAVVASWRAGAAGEHSGLSNDGVMSLLEDSRGRLWAGLFGGGVARKDKGATRFSPLQDTPNNKTGLLGTQGLALVEDLTGTVWIGTELGLSRYDETSGTFEAFTHSPEDNESLAAESVYALHVDSAGQLWIGTAGGGLDKAVTDSTGVRFEHQNEVLKLGMNLIYGIRSDLNGNLWLSGNRGLVRYNPVTREGKRFREAHGLQGDEFNFGAHHAGIDGHLYFGGTKGFNRFNPEDVSAPASAPQVAITRVQLGGEDVVNQFASTMKQLTVGYDNDVVAFEFAALDYVDAASNRFEYRLRGHNDLWIDAGTSRRVSYSNVSAGTYLLEIRGANSAGVWSTEPAAIEVIFEPPPWFSTAAYTCYALLGMGLLFACYRALRARRDRGIAHRRELHRLAYFDGLTKLPNRHKLLEKGASILTEAPDQMTAVLHINLDHFKRLNDSLGHAMADRLLVEFTKRLRTQARAISGVDRNPVLARIGGDEFAVVIPAVESDALATLFAGRLQTALSETLRVDLTEALITVSVGVSLFPRDGKTMGELLKHADIAMRGAKQNGRNTYRGFESAMVTATEADLQLEAELHSATQGDQLELYYQPKVNASDLRVCGAEALIRWNHPERGMVSPGVFVPMAERSGLISRVDRWVMQRAFEQQQHWQSSQFPRIVSSLNVSAGQFSRSEFIDYLRELNERYAVDPQALEIEITEGVLMQDAEAARKTLAQIKDLGFRISIDDFGTGYSSLSYLKNFAVDVLKIDRSFVMDLETDHNNRSICRAVLGLARSLGMKVVAEGVETEAQYEFLRDEGCDQIQGYWIARPAPVSTFEAYVTEQFAIQQSIEKVANS